MLYTKGTVSAVPTKTCALTASGAKQAEKRRTASEDRTLSG
jgi:hypothetical protein